MPILLASHDNVEAFCTAASECDRLAIDTEFHPERRYVPDLFLVQVHLENGETWLFDPLIDGLLAKAAVGLRRCTWVVHSGAIDLQLLSHAIGDLPPCILDTQVAAGIVTHRYPAPLSALLKRFVGVEVDKSETLSDWSHRPLTDAQQRYAKNDVEHLLPLWDKLLARAAKRSKEHIVLAACEEARIDALAETEPDASWRHIPASRRLPRHTLAVLQELACWRDEHARAANQPIHTIASNAALVGLAKRQPLTEAALRSDRRLPRGLGKHAATLVERIGRAAKRPQWAWPDVIRRDTPAARIRDAVVLAAQVHAQGEDYSANLALPEAEADRVAASWIADGTIPLRGWRREILAPFLEEFLAGKTSLMIRDHDLSASVIPD